MAFNISYVYEIVDKASRPIAKLVKKQVAFAKGALVAARNALKLGGSLDQLRKKAKSAGEAMKRVGSSLTTRVTAPLGVFAGMALFSAAKLETLETSFESMLGSADKARETMKQLIEFTAKTPFQLEGVGRSAKQLLAFGVATKDLLPTLNVLGDISAGANVPLTEMAAIFGKVKAKGKAYTEELLQMSDRGIPIIDVLAKKFGVSKEAVFEAAAAGKISFKIIQDALRGMTAQGGIFNRQMERQSKTLGGLFSTLRDNVTLAMGEVGTTLVETFDLKEIMKDVISAIQTAMAAFSNFVKNNPKLAKFGIILVAIAAVMGPLVTMLGIMTIAAAAISTPILIAVAAFSAIAVAIAAVLAFKDDIANFFHGVKNQAIMAAQPIIDAWNNVKSTIVDSITAVTGKIQMVKEVFGIGGDVKAPGAQEVTGQMGVNINLSGNTQAVESVSARQTGGNLGMNMAVSAP